MEAYLETLNFWEAVGEDYEVLPLPKNPTMAQIKYHENTEKHRQNNSICWCFKNHLHYLKEFGII